MKKTIAGALMIITVVLAITGCQTESDTKLSFRETAITGTVISVAGDEVTLSLGTKHEGALGGDLDNPPKMNDDGVQPERPNGEMLETDGMTVVLNVVDKTVVEFASLDDLVAGNQLRIVFDKNGTITSITMASEDVPVDTDIAFDGGAQTENNGTSATTFTADAETAGESYTSDADDENAVRVEVGANVTLDKATVTKTGESSNREDSDFYGLNAGVLVRDEGVLTINGGTYTTDSTGGNGIFAYGEGTTADISDAVIRTSMENSGGIELAGGAQIEATNLDVETNGSSSAAIRSDRGGGTMNVDSGIYVTNGTGSPVVYSTADVTVKNAAMTANNSEAVVVEGANAVSLKGCDVSGNMTGTYGDDSTENLQTVMLYQSMSGDASVGQSSLSMTGGSLLSNSGDTFYVTNTACAIELDEVEITNADGYLLKVAGNDGSRGWGNAGNNGGECELAVNNQMLEGDVLVDDDSTLTMTMSGKSQFMGTINGDGAGGEVTVALKDDSVWELTDDAYITGFTGNTDYINAKGYNVYVNGESILNK